MGRLSSDTYCACSLRFTKSFKTTVTHIMRAAYSIEFAPTITKRPPRNVQNIIYIGRSRFYMVERKQYARVKIGRPIARSEKQTLVHPAYTSRTSQETEMMFCNLSGGPSGSTVPTGGMTISRRSSSTEVIGSIELASMYRTSTDGGGKQPRRRRSPGALSDGRGPPRRLGIEKATAASIKS